VSAVTRSGLLYVGQLGPILLSPCSQRLGDFTLNFGDKVEVLHFMEADVE